MIRVHPWQHSPMSRAKEYIIYPAGFDNFNKIEEYYWCLRVIRRDHDMWAIQLRDNLALNQHGELEDCSGVDWNDPLAFNTRRFLFHGQEALNIARVNVGNIRNNGMTLIEWLARTSMSSITSSVPTRTHNIYVASSWRNIYQPQIVELLRNDGHGVYDFRNPLGNKGFAWSEVDPEWSQWTAQQYIGALDHPRAIEGFNSDFSAMQWADTFVLVLPCGRSAHLELGWAVGAGKRTAILTRDGEEPELMAKMCDLVTDSTKHLLDWVGAETDVKVASPETIFDASMVQYTTSTVI